MNISPANGVCTVSFFDRPNKSLELARFLGVFSSIRGDADILTVRDFPYFSGPFRKYCQLLLKLALQNCQVPV